MLILLWSNLGHKCIWLTFTLCCHQGSSVKVKGHLRSNVKFTCKTLLLQITSEPLSLLWPNLGHRCIWGAVTLCCHQGHMLRSKVIWGHLLKFTCKILMWQITLSLLLHYQPNMGHYAFKGFLVGGNERRSKIIFGKMFFTHNALWWLVSLHTVFQVQPKLRSRMFFGDIHNLATGGREWQSDDCLDLTINSSLVSFAVLHS